MEIFIKDLILKHKNQPCVVVGAGHEMFNFDYKNFKGITIIAGGSTILRVRDKIIPNYLVSANNHFPIAEIKTHRKIINKYPLMTWLIGETTCYDSIWDKDLEVYKKKIAPNYFFFDDKHFKRKKCHPNKNCCKFLDINPKKKMIYEIISDIFKNKINFSKTGVSVSDLAIAFAVLFGCNPIFIQGIDLPLSKYTTINYKQYFGSEDKIADNFDKKNTQSLRIKFFFYHLKNLNFAPYFYSFKEKILRILLNRSVFYYGFNNSIKILKWLSKTAKRNKQKIYNLSSNSNLSSKKIFPYLKKQDLKKNIYKKFFRN